jgi:hypothetical protein
MREADRKVQDTRGVCRSERIAHMSAALAWLLVLAALCLSGAHAQSQDRAPAAEVKAAFLLKFPSFVEWPASQQASGAFVIGIAGAPEIHDELRTYAAGQKIHGRPVQVRLIESPDEIAGVHMLFIGRDETARLQQFAAAANANPVLIVTDTPDGLQRGGMINFVTRDRVQFEIALDAAEKAGLRLSSRLLSVAIRVKKGEAEAEWLLARESAPRTFAARPARS